MNLVYFTNILPVLRFLLKNKSILNIRVSFNWLKALSLRTTDSNDLVYNIY